MAAPCVYYDGACPLCSREIAAYQRSLGAEQLRWVDAAACPGPALGPQLPREAALARLHVRLPDGRLLSGAAAFVAIWQRLPAFHMLARLARLPGAVTVMEAAYRGFLALRPLWRRQALPAEWLALPTDLRRELRTDHAGEAGAVMIYRGVLAWARDAELRRFAQHHLDTERRHLAEVEAVVPVSARSRLLPLWRLAGALTGALPSLFGPRAVYATIDAVETFVDRHYAAQVEMIDRRLATHAAETRATAMPNGTPDAAEARPTHDAGEAPGVDTDPRSARTLPALRAWLEACRLDEVAHRDDARAHRDVADRGSPPRWIGAWTTMVQRGSAAAVRVSRHV